MDDSPQDDEALGRGLQVDHLNPPQIEMFVKGLPRRVDEQLTALRPNAPTDDLVALLTAIGDRQESTIEDLVATGYAPDTSVEVALPRTVDESDLHPDLNRARDRFEAASVEVARRLAGIPTNGWESNPELLGKLRQAVVRTSALIRAVADAVQTANESTGSTD
jgi:hypothetical protein